MDFRKDLIRTFYPSMPNRINNTVTNFDDWLNEPVSKIETLISEGTLPEKTMAEYIIDFYAATVLPSSKVVDIGKWKDNSATYIREDLEYLNRKLSVVRKTITAWDTYKVVEVVTEPELLGAKIQGLPLNSSLIVNTPTSVLLNNNNYSMGDIVFKDINGIIHRLQSQPSGFFYPSNIAQQGTSNTIQITYSFASGSQPYNPEAEIDENPLTEPAQNIKTTIIMEEDSLPYNHSFELQKGDSENDIIYHFDSDSNSYIPPKIFAYIMDEGVKGEEIYIDQNQLWTIEGSEDNKTITVTNNTSFTSIYITMR